jgi:imidazole glycerol-phosphate synthase subunit HisH
VSDTVIVDSGGANLASLQFALARLGVASIVTDDPQRVASASRVVLPGVGAAGDAMHRLRSRGMDQVIPSLKVPLLGICLGMQLLFEHSSEDDTRCLGVLPGGIGRLQPRPTRPVPHMGWNTLESMRADPLLRDIEPSDRLYFVHSYVAPVSSTTLASVQYGDSFAAVVRWNNFSGVQFHPERSGPVGARVLRNFVSL